MLLRRCRGLTHDPCRPHPTTSRFRREGRQVHSLRSIFAFSKGISGCRAVRFVGSAFPISCIELVPTGLHATELGAGRLSESALSGLSAWGFGCETRGKFCVEAFSFLSAIFPICCKKAVRSLCLG